jgi:hypothetical protein
VFAIIQIYIYQNDVVESSIGSSLLESPFATNHLIMLTMDKNANMHPTIQKVASEISRVTPSNTNAVKLNINK